ncbi:hypothetical protein BOW35_12910 [Solemya velum gill symbiont]|nr:hypothetical protein BOW35_12910 [Solemya velum gill symbiont]
MGEDQMVPQPVSELEENIAFIKLATLGVGVLGIALAMLISWFLAKKWLVHPRNWLNWQITLK